MKALKAILLYLITILINSQALAEDKTCQFSLSPHLSDNRDDQVFLDEKQLIQLERISNSWNGELLVWATRAGSAKRLKAQIYHKIDDVLSDTLILAEELPETLFKEFILRKVEDIKAQDVHIREANRIIKERYSNHKFSNSNVKAQESKIPLHYLNKIYNGARGKWFEIYAFPKFQNIIGFDVKLKDLVSKDAIRMARRSGFHGDALEQALNREIDFLLADGTWVEIKHFKAQFNPQHRMYSKTMKKADDVSLLARYEGISKGQQIPVHFVFFHGGVDNETQNILREKMILALNP